MPSVVRDWIHPLPFKVQAVLLVALRGCDTVSKFDPAKELTTALRWIVLNPAKKDPGTFMRTAPPDPIPNLDPYPHHWVTHTMHAVQIVAYCHPIEEISAAWYKTYQQFCAELHMPPEGKEQMLARLQGELG